MSREEGVSLRSHLKELSVDEGLSSILLDLAATSARIYASIDIRDMGKEGAENASGDTQSALDVSSDQMIAEALDNNPIVCSHLNEECVELRTCSARGTYFVSYDPYDGGSVGDANITVGSIFGIWRETPSLGDLSGKNFVCGAYALWGPRLIFAFATKEQGVFWYEYRGGSFLLLGPLDFDSGKRHKGIFCPGDSPVLATSKEYEELFRYALSSKLRLRYTGCCVTDAHHVLHKKGMFWYPPGKKGGLRLMYEFVPLGFMFLCAGGTAIDHEGRSVLEIPITDWHQRTSFLLASSEFGAEASALFRKIS